MSIFQLFLCVLPSYNPFQQISKNMSMIYMSRLRQTRFDQLFWHHNPQTKNNCQKYENSTRHQKFQTRPKWKFITLPEACLVCIWSPLKPFLNLRFLTNNNKKYFFDLHVKKRPGNNVYRLSFLTFLFDPCRSSWPRRGSLLVVAMKYCAFVLF